MESRSEWRAKLALAGYFALVGGIFVGSIIVGLILILIGIGAEDLDLSFPVALISSPVTETIILGITLLFARYKGAGLKELGLKKTSIKILAVVSAAAVALFLLGVGIIIFEEVVFGPDPMTGLVEEAVVPRNSFQLIVMLIFSLVLVGPCEELAFRGFVQKGFENSFGKMRGLLIASVLFGLLHGLNTLYSILPAFGAGLFLGYVWQKTGGNTTTSALMHGINNSIAIVLAYLATM